MVLLDVPPATVGRGVQLDVGRGVGVQLVGVQLRRRGRTVDEERGREGVIKIRLKGRQDHTCIAERR